LSRDPLQNLTNTSEALAGQKAPKVDPKQARRAFWRMLALVRPHRRILALGIFLGLFVAITYAASLGGILPVLKVIVEKESLRAYLLSHSDKWFSPVTNPLANWLPEDTSAGARMTSLGYLLGVLVFINLVGNTLRVFSQYMVLYASHRVVMDLRRKMYRKALHLPVNEIQGQVGVRVSQFMTDVREVYLGLATLFGKLAREPLKAICVLAVAIYLDARLTLAVLVIAPAVIGVFWIVGRKIRKATVKLLQGYGFMLSNLEEALQGVDVVKTYSREGHERKRMWQLERRMMKQQLKLVWVQSLTSPAIEILGLLAASGGIIWLAGRTFNGDIQPSHFMTMVILLAAMLDPIRKTANVYNVVQRAGAASIRLFEFLDQEEEHSAAHARRLPPPGDGGRAVEFADISFRYNENAKPALSDVSLSVRTGECIVLVGPNGSGKSTLLRTLPRLLDPQSGTIRIDGIDIHEVSLNALRSQIAIVSQRPVIFARSAAENIAYGYPNATPEQIRDAAQRAHADEFIEALPDQYETVMGEFGSSLSGGQRQRISIARAFLKPASILIFDEATSEIDAESESKIHDALEHLREGKTTFLIAHRHTVMDMADRIAVFDGGKIVDVGTHAELMERCPLFVALYRSPAVR
jgi:ABC-type multidrug transport system fused ATPase/permease subunit